MEVDGLPLHVLVLLTTAVVWVTVLSGQVLRADRFAGAGGPLGDQIEKHADDGVILRNIATGFGAHRLGALLLVAAVATGVYTFLAGEAGARAVWDR